ncbi:MAG: hypothetical protein E7534_00025 [Ruminococcaceae bacterium]|nr:hypothetical protein [Oscillospiraceae bacterium]
MNERDIAALKADWTQFCDQNAKDDWAALAARIAAPAPQKTARRWIFATSLVAAAAAIMLVCLPILNAWRDVTADKNSSGDAPMSPDDGYYENMDGVFDASTTAPSRGEDINYGGEHGSDKNDGNGENGNANGGTPSSTVATTNPTIYYSESQAPTAPGFVSPNASGRPYGSSGEPQGGDSPYDYFRSSKFSGIFNEFMEWVCDNYGKNAFDVYEENKNKGEKSVKYEWSLSTHEYVRRFNMPRDVFEELNRQAKESYKKLDYEWELENNTFTDEEIDDIYNLTWPEFARKYAAEHAIVTEEGHIYRYDWLVDNPVEKWVEKGFTVEQVKAAYDSAESFGRGTTAVKEKLIRFTAAEMDRTVYGDGYNTYISHARWNRIDDILMDYMVDTYGQEAVDAFKAQLDAEKNGKFYASRGDAINRWLAHFGITRATFEQLNEQLYLHYATTYGKDSFECWDNVFTTAEIDDIYALSLEEFNMKYAHPCTYVIGEYVYNFGWFLDKTWEDLWSYEVFKGRRLVALAELHAKYYPDKAADYNAFKKEADRYNFESGGK